MEQGRKDHVVGPTRTRPRDPRYAEIVEMSAVMHWDKHDTVEWIAETPELAAKYGVLVGGVAGRRFAGRGTWVSFGCVRRRSESIVPLSLPDGRTHPGYVFSFLGCWVR